MPFQSEAQRRYLWANHPEIAKRWSAEYGSTPVKKRKHKKVKRHKGTPAHKRTMHRMRGKIARH